MHLPRCSSLVAVLVTALTFSACADRPPGAEPDADAGDGAASPSAAATATDPALAAVGHHFAPGQVIVKLTRPIDPAAPLDLAGLTLRPLKPLPSGTWLMQLDAGHLARRADVAAATLDALDQLRADPAVEYAHENAAFALSLAPSDPEAHPVSGRQAWALHQANLYAAWDVTQGSTGVRIALIDSGRREHPDLVGRWAPGYDFIWDDADPTDDPATHPGGFDWAHGVHVAGIAGARANNATGGAGVCWNCPLVPLRVTPSFSTALNPIGIAYVAELELAVAWAAGPDGGPRRAEVINFSLNHQALTDCHDPLFTGFRQQVERAIARGVVVVSSAGNLPTQNGVTAPRVPATCPGVIAVIASAPGGTIPAYSARGAGTDLVAPGGGLDLEMHYGAGVGCPTSIYGDGTQGVFAPWSYRDGGPDLHCYRHLSGTSMAAPHVSGVVALMRSVNATLTPAQIEQYLLATARLDRVTCPAPGQCGAGMIDAHAAVLAARDGLGADLVITPTALAFPPTRLTTTSAPLALTVRNAAAGTLTAQLGAPPQRLLACAGGPCSCSSAAACTVSAGGGQQATLHVRYAPTAAGPFAANLTVQSNDPGEPSVVVPVTGIGTVSVASISPDVMHFGYVPVGTTAPAQTVTLVNAGTAPLTLTALSPTGHVGDYVITPVTPVPTTVAPGGSASVAVRCAPTSAGRKTIMLALVNDANVPGQPVDIRCEAVAPEARLIVAAPGPHFGGVPVGTAASRAVHVLNVSPGTTTLAFTLSRPAAPFRLTCTSGCACTTTACAGTVTSGQGGASLTLEYAPTAITSHAATLAFTSTAPTLPTASIATTGAGVAGRLEVLQPTSGALELTDGALTGSVIVRNPGALPVALGGWAVEPATKADDVFTVSGPKLASLAPGAVTSWSVTCAPTLRTGVHRGRLLLVVDSTKYNLVELVCRVGPS